MSTSIDKNLLTLYIIAELEDYDYPTIPLIMRLTGDSKSSVKRRIRYWRDLGLEIKFLKTEYYPKGYYDVVDFAWIDRFKFLRFFRKEFREMLLDIANTN